MRHSSEEISRAVRELGLAPGTMVLVEADATMGSTLEQVLREVVGPNGTVLTAPASNGGAGANGSHAAEGKGALYENLCLAKGKLVRTGPINDFADYIGSRSNSPWLYKKLFTREEVTEQGLRKLAWVGTERRSDPQVDEFEGHVAREAEGRGIIRKVQLNGTGLSVVDAEAYRRLWAEELRRWQERGRLELDRPRRDASNESTPALRLGPKATSEEMIAALWKLPRDIVSDGYDSALNALATVLPMTIHEYPTGTECWDWILPEKWTCDEAYLETLDGRRLFSYSDHPLHVVSYSLPFEGVVSREELLKHLHVHTTLPEAVPFVFKYYERDWGLCCSRTLRDSLTEDRYRVVIRTRFEYGTLKVGEVVVPGSGAGEFILCAHLCHPGQVNDDLTGVVVGMEVMRELQKRRDLRHTYRFLIVPETIGSIAWLSHNESLIPRMKGGLFLEMLGVNQPHHLQQSFEGDTELDRLFARVMGELDPASRIGAYRTVIVNDEAQFNAPGVRVPMLSLSRVNTPRAPYPEYHSSFDTPECISMERLSESREMTLRMIDALERNVTPVNRYKGEVFCSRHGLHVDWFREPERNQCFFDVLHAIDGTRSVLEIAERTGASFDAVWSIVSELESRKLVGRKAPETRG